MKKYILSLILMILVGSSSAPEASAWPWTQPKQPIWVPTWYASPVPNATAGEEITDMTVRQIVRINTPAKSVRIRLSNAYGSTPLRIDQVGIASRASASAIRPETAARVSFQGHDDVTIPPGAYVISDPLSFEVAAPTDLAVSLYVSATTKLATLHARQRKATYHAMGNVVDSETLAPLENPPGGSAVLWLSEVEVTGTPAKQAVVAFGDSITDGSGPAADTNATWPDFLADRLAAAGIDLSVINAGIGGNRLLHNGTRPSFGEAGLARFEADVLAQPNIRAVIVLIGINDIGHPGQDAGPEDYVSPEDIGRGLSQLAVRAHAKGLKIFVGTLTPFKVTTIKNYYSDSKEQDRQSVNAWIRANKVFDGVIDFEKALEDPAKPGQILPLYDSKDHLHPSAEGNKAIAAAVPLNWLK